MEEYIQAVMKDVELSSRAQQRLEQIARGALMYDVINLEGTGRLAIAAVGRMRSECMPSRKKSPRKLPSRKKSKREVPAASESKANPAADAASTKENEGELSDSETTVYGDSVFPVIYDDGTVEPPRFDFEDERKRIMAELKRPSIEVSPS